MQVDVKDILTGCFTIGKEKIYPFATDATLAQCLGEVLRHLKHVTTGSLIQFGKGGGVLVWNNQQVSRVDGLNIHERAA